MGSVGSSTISNTQVQSYIDNQSYAALGQYISANKKAFGLSPSDDAYMRAYDIIKQHQPREYKSVSSALNLSDFGDTIEILATRKRNGMEEAYGTQVQKVLRRGGEAVYVDTYNGSSSTAFELSQRYPNKNIDTVIVRKTYRG